jgi:hypothetical protein
MFRKNIVKQNNWEENLETYGAEEGAETLTMCRKCYSFQYENGWHFERPSYLSENDEISVQFSQCPSCVEETLAMYDTEYA